MSSSQINFQKKRTYVLTATEVIGDKWSPCLLCALSNKPMRFNQLQEQLSRISPRTLSQRLSKLETMGIISKKIISQVPPHTEYTLTQKGLELLPILRSMIVWGEKYQVV